jgi:hypothetical protein
MLTVVYSGFIARSGLPNPLPSAGFGNPTGATV